MIRNINSIFCNCLKRYLISDLGYNILLRSIFSSEVEEMQANNHSSTHEQTLHNYYANIDEYIIIQNIIIG